MPKAYKYRLYPNEDQQQLIEKTFGCCRLVYNLALEVKIAAYSSLRVSLSSFDLCYQLADLKEVSPWLNEVDSQALQAISDVSIGEFFRQMEYKCNWYGKNLVKIGRFEPTSKTCSVCGEINETLTLTDRWWICTNCHSTHDWDLNAAKNIRRIGLIQSGEGISREPVERWRLHRARKQEVPYG